MTVNKNSSREKDALGKKLIDHGPLSAEEPGWRPRIAKDGVLAQVVNLKPWTRKYSKESQI